MFHSFLPHWSSSSPLFIVFIQFVTLNRSQQSFILKNKQLYRTILRKFYCIHRTLFQMYSVYRKSYIYCDGLTFGNGTVNDRHGKSKSDGIEMTNSNNAIIIVEVGVSREWILN